MAILLVYLSLLYVEKKQRYEQLNDVTAKLIMCHLHKFHHSYCFKVKRRNNKIIILVV